MDLIEEVQWVSPSKIVGSNLLSHVETKVHGYLGGCRRQTSSDGRHRQISVSVLPFDVILGSLDLTLQVTPCFGG